MSARHQLLLAGAGKRVITYVGQGTIPADFAVSPWNVTMPSGLATNDLVIVLTVSNGDPTSTGWTEFGNLSYFNLFYRRVPAGGLAAQSFSNASGWGMSWAYRGCVAAGTPYEDLHEDAHTGQAVYTGGTQPLGSGRMIVNCAAGSSGINSFGYYNPFNPDFTARFDEQQYDSGHGGVGSCWLVSDVEGHAGVLQESQIINSGLSVNNVIWTFALIPA